MYLSMHTYDNETIDIFLNFVITLYCMIEFVVNLDCHLYKLDKTSC